MKAKKLTKVISAMLSAIMLLSTTQVGLTAFASEVQATETTQASTQPIMSETIELEPEVIEDETEVIEEESEVTDIGVHRTDTLIGSNTVTGGGYSDFDKYHEGMCGTNVRYKLNGSGVLTISGEGPMADYNVSFNYPNVLKRPLWEPLREYIKSVVIEDGVTSIGAYAFYGYKDLISVSLPDTLTTISSGAFQETRLREATIPNSVTSIGVSTFPKEVKITEHLFVPFTIKATIGSYAKLYCDRNDIPFESTGVLNHEGSCGPTAHYFLDSANGVFTISGKWDTQNYARVNDPYGGTPVPWNLYTDYIKSVVIEDGITSIGNNIFYRCKNLTSVSIANSVRKINSCAFKECPLLESITIPDGVENIVSGAFSYCPSLESITIPDSVTSIGDSAFSDCTSLESITIPDSVTTIGSGAFIGCTSLKNVKMSKNVKTYDSLFCNCKSLENIEIPDGVTRLSGQIFRGTSLKTISIPNSVTYIDSLAFYDLKDLVIIKAMIGSYAKLYCDRNDIKFESTGVINYEGECGENVTYFLDTVNCVLTISGNGDMKNYQYDGYTVNKISQPWEIYRDYVKTVVIEDGITSIGKDLLYGCEKLTSVSIPDSVTKIGDSAFEGCISLESIEIPDSVTTIGGSAFQNCKTLKNIEMSKNVKIYEDYLFRNCLLLENFEMVDGVTEINREAFAGTALKSIKIPESVTTIKYYAFQSCEYLENVEMPKNIKEYESCLFLGCKSLKNIEIADGVTTIGSMTFNGTAIKTINIPNSVTSIGNNAFGGLTDLTIKAMIGSYAKLYCDRNDIAFESTGVINHEGSCGENATYFLDTVNGVFTVSGSGAMQNYYSSNQPWQLYSDYIKTVVIEDGITSIGNITFIVHKYLTSVTIPDSVTTIGTQAFYSCSSLKEIKMSKNVKVYSYYLFYGCTSLESIEIAEGVTTIDVCAFSNTAIKTITIPDSVTSIGSNAFSSCSSLEKVEMSKNVKKYAGGLFSNCTSLESIEIADGVTELGGSVFASCKSLKNIKIPDSVTSIGNSAFANCDLLESITIPDRVTTIGTYAFYNCSSLKKVEMSKNVKVYSSNLFQDCKSLESIEIADGVTTIDSYAFQNTAIKTITIPDSVTAIGTHAFYNCTSLKNVEMSKNVKTYLNGLFYNCTSLESIEIPDGVTEIGGYAFSNTALKRITVPNSVTTIGLQAFSSCKNLMYLVVPETTVTIDNNITYNSADATIVGFVGSAIHDYALRGNLKFSPITGAGEGFAICETEETYKGMILRFASQDGKSEYTKILTADSKNAIYGLDTKKTYKAEIVSQNGNVFCSKSNISFGDSDFVSIVFENAKKPLATKVKLKDKDGNELKKFTVSWTDKNGKHISSEKILKERLEGEVLYCEITIDKSLLSEYKTPKKASITLSNDSDNILTINLEKQEIYTLSGVVSNSDNKTLSGVSVAVTHTLVNGEKRVYNTASDKDGKYSFSLCGGDYQLTISKTGYFDKTISGELSKNTTQDIVLEKLSGAKINCILDVVKTKISNIEPITLEELDISIYNKTQEKSVESFALENDIFYFDSEDVFVGDVLEFTCKDTNGTYNDTQTTVTYTGSKDSVKIQMIEKGKISCTIKNTQNKENIMILFDSNGKYLDNCYFNNLSASSKNLNEGQYTVVVMGENTSALAVDSLTTLKKYGFVDKVDYQSYSVEVKKGEITEIKDIDVPELNDDKMIYLDAEKTSLVSNSTNIPLGQFATLKAEYFIKDEYLSEMTDKKIKISVPENLSIPANGVSLNNIPISNYTLENGILTVNVNEKSGVIRVVLYNVHSADKVNVSARLQFTFDGKEMLQPIGSVDLKLGELDFRVPLKTSQTNITAYGITYTDSEVFLYDNGVVVASQKTKSTGTFVLPFNLYNAYDKSKHKIWIEVKKPDGSVIRSQTKIVKYAKDMPVVSEIRWINGGGETSINLLNPKGLSTPVFINDLSKVFTFKVLCTGDATLLKNVVIITTDGAGRQTKIPTIYDEESGAFVGSQLFGSNGVGFPESIAVEYDSDYDDSSIDFNVLLKDVFEKNIVDELSDALEYFESNPPTITIDSDGNYKATMDFYLDGDSLRLEYILSAKKYFITTNYYINNIHYMTEETSFTSLSSAREEIDRMKKDGYFTRNDIGGLSGNAGVTSMGKDDPQSGSYSQAYVTDDGYKYENNSRLTPEGRKQSLNPASLLWRVLTGDKSYGQWQEMLSLLDRLDECYEKRGLPKVDRDHYYILGSLNSIASLGNLSMNAMKLDDYGSFIVSNALSEADENLAKIYGHHQNLKEVDEFLDNYNDLLNGDSKKSAEAFGNIFKNGGSKLKDLIAGKIYDNKDKAMDNVMQDLRDDVEMCEDPWLDNIEVYVPSQDPSGYICEAVDSNRVEGVTCTVYYSPYSDGSDAVIWDASEYDQENPLISDKNGHYEWLVPVGYWQVKFEKEGYATTYSDWLPVPPPQTEVNVAMIALDAPKIKNIYAYQNEIDIEFTQYMNIYTVTNKTITVTLNGEKVTGKIVPVNAEIGFENPALEYASKFRFVPDEKFSKGDKVKVSIANAVNYADNTIEAVENEYEVILKPELIKADESVNIKLKDTKEITIQVEPGEAGANQNVTVTSNSSVLEILTPNVTTDSEGKATVKVRGSLPGQAEITYQLENSDCVGTTTLTIEMPKQKVAPVTASVKSGTTLNKGDKIEFSCATEGAEIYYTTDLSCPCILTSDARIKYTGPIEITEYTTFMVYAVKEGMEDSKTTLFIYDVAEVTGDIDDDGVFSITDVTCLQKYLANAIVLDEETLEKCDFNNDGDVNISDVTFMQRVLAEFAVFA